MLASTAKNRDPSMIWSEVLTQSKVETVSAVAQVSGIARFLRVLEKLDYVSKVQASASAIARTVLVSDQTSPSRYPANLAHRPALRPTLRHWYDPPTR